jgi:hypothetical protein
VLQSKAQQVFPPRKNPYLATGATFEKQSEKLVGTITLSFEKTIVSSSARKLQVANTARREVLSLGT